ncbi:MAG: TrkA family potassium uptake protein [Clostridia bacterium]|nr:TrkA family potassium uptake protein [Clostridia bacterium]
MKSILLIGIGRFGMHIAMKLFELGHQVLAVDVSEKRIDSVLPYVTHAQIGDSTNREFLRSLGIPAFDTCIVAIGDDFQHSLETAWLLKELGARKVISRASQGLQEKFLLKNGADEVVYPEKQLASWTAIRCSSEHILEYVELDDRHAMVEMDVPRAWDGKTILELDVRRRMGLNVLGVRENGRLNMSVMPDTVLSSGQSILVAGNEKAIHKCIGL